MDRWTKTARKRIAVVCCASLALVLVSCSSRPSAETPLQKQARTLSSLPGLRGSTNPQLATELQQLETQQQLPAQLDAAIQPGTYAPSSPPIPQFLDPPCNAK